MWAIILLGSFQFNIQAQDGVIPSPRVKTDADIVNGAERIQKYLAHIGTQNVAVVANHTAMIGDKHLVDILLENGRNVKKVFAPEHGFRGSADAGEIIKDGKDVKTGIPMISLYGSNKKPSKENLKDVDVVVFDIQDVGVRFYTYISTMTYVMEACAENDKTIIILDRPNPNGYYVDGPVLKPKHKSFIGMHPIPIVHGMTVGELAMMIKAEGWITSSEQCKLIVIPCENYEHNDLYQLPIKPSPNLPNMASVYLYPSVCLFEGTALSVGRGTPKPFQFIGHPKLENTTASYTPKSTQGAKNPKFKGEECKGFDLEDFASNYIKSYRKLYLYWILGIYKGYHDKENFFKKSFNLLAGNAELQDQIKKGMGEDEIRKTWQNDLIEFKAKRRKYLLYPEFGQINPKR